MTSSLIAGVALGQTDSATGAFSGPIASEVGLLLLVGAVGFMGGFGLRWLWRCVRTLLLMIIVVAVALWLIEVGPPTVSAPNVLVPSVHGASETVQALLAAPLRAGIGAVGFILGLLVSRRGNARRCE